MHPKLDVNYGASTLSIYACAFPDGYAFLLRCDTTTRPMVQLEHDALMDYWERKGWPNQGLWPNMIVRWAQLQLPNGQRARSIWSDSNSKASLRRTSCVEIEYDGKMCITNVAYYFYLQFDDLKYPLAVINLFSLPDVTLLSQSSQTVYLCDALEGLDAIRVIPITSIKSVVSMFPEHRVTRDGKLINTRKFMLL
ncbi:hypothetical protein L208DRAFT_1290253 [Tricholoma matsutake]|nr:hypothetical protein L208DRAFT_1290253 [Tricholoma matsutake 945]